MEYRYHRLARSSEIYRWWRLPLATLLGIVMYFWATLLLFGGAWLIDSSALDFALGDEMDLTDPMTMALTLGSLAVFIPVIYFSLFAVWYRPIGLISSVEGRLRWGWLARTTAWAALIYIATYVVWSFLDGSFANFDISTMSSSIALLIVALVLTPFQAAAEEYLFRGFLTQLLGSWINSAIIVGTITLLLFVAGHIYDVWGLIDVGMFAVFATYLVWRTGGLEASIAAHVMNNLIIFIMGAFGLADLNAEEGSFVGVIGTLATMAVFSFIVVKQANSRGLAIVRTVKAESVVTYENDGFASTAE